MLNNKIDTFCINLLLYKYIQSVVKYVYSQISYLIQEMYVR